MPVEYPVDDNLIFFRWDCLLFHRRSYRITIVHFCTVPAYLVPFAWWSCEFEPDCDGSIIRVNIDCYWFLCLVNTRRWWRTGGWGGEVIGLGIGWACLFRGSWFLGEFVAGFVCRKAGKRRCDLLHWRRAVSQFFVWFSIARISFHFR